jgi:hypothetical protein
MSAVLADSLILLIEGWRVYSRVSVEEGALFKSEHGVNEVTNLWIGSLECLVLVVGVEQLVDVA